ncbi:hypothetical protein QAD02_003147 [Eretmocerus hayati]|uniref:Uncharacterized protein n=1 Tax=Eretmocerus hayati TaxID=131215 RepID=A0ACC2NL11_9HYME|nr:hypothetical protein QAD02_003147 [Eretmocerus hayati]
MKTLYIDGREELVIDKVKLFKYVPCNENAYVVFDQLMRGYPYGPSTTYHCPQCKSGFQFNIITLEISSTLLRNQTIREDLIDYFEESTQNVCNFCLTPITASRSLGSYLCLCISNESNVGNSNNMTKISTNLVTHEILLNGQRYRCSGLVAYEPNTAEDKSHLHKAADLLGFGPSTVGDKTHLEETSDRCVAYCLRLDGSWVLKDDMKKRSNPLKPPFCQDLCIALILYVRVVDPIIPTPPVETPTLQDSSVDRWAQQMDVDEPTPTSQVLSFNGRTTTLLHCPSSSVAASFESFLAMDIDETDSIDPLALTHDTGIPSHSPNSAIVEARDMTSLRLLEPGIDQILQRIEMESSSVEPYTRRPSNPELCGDDPPSDFSDSEPEEWEGEEREEDWVNNIYSTHRGGPVMKNGGTFLPSPDFTQDGKLIQLINTCPMDSLFEIFQVARNSISNLVNNFITAFKSKYPGDSQFFGMVENYHDTKRRSVHYKDRFEFSIYNNYHTKKCENLTVIDCADYVDALFETIMNNYYCVQSVLKCSNCSQQDVKRMKLVKLDVDDLIEYRGSLEILQERLDLMYKARELCRKCKKGRTEGHHEFTRYFCLDLWTNYQLHITHKTKLKDVPVTLMLGEREKKYTLIGIVAFTPQKTDDPDSIIHYFSYVRLGNGCWVLKDGMKDEKVMLNSDSCRELSPALLLYINSTNPREPLIL